MLFCSVVAVDLRGYNESDKPSGIANYRSDQLAQDLKELVAALGECCVLTVDVLVRFRLQIVRLVGARLGRCDRLGPDDPVSGNRGSARHVQLPTSKGL